MNIPWRIIAMALLKPYRNHFRLPVTKASLFRDPWSSTTAVCAIFTTFAQHFGWLWRSNGGFHSHGGIPSSLDGLFMFISMGKFNSNKWMIGFYLDMGGIHINQVVKKFDGTFDESTENFFCVFPHFLESWGLTGTQHTTCSPQKNELDMNLLCVSENGYPLKLPSNFENFYRGNDFITHIKGQGVAYSHTKPFLSS